MKVIMARNVQQIIPEAARALSLEGIARQSRNGPVLVMPTPVTSVYLKPEERVLFWAERDANPFFHFFESLWMLAGRNDIAYVKQYNQQMVAYSDDGVTQHGAYGHRWRVHFNVDQLPKIINALRENADDRRCVLGMWDPEQDLGRQGKDVPCNLVVTFHVTHDKRLDMMVANRSNDAVWGAYGANAVHFSVLQEYIALGAGYRVGTYYQVSANLHAYQETFPKIEPLGDLARNERSQLPYDPYAQGRVRPFPLMMVRPEVWDRDLKVFLDEGLDYGYGDRFFPCVAVPLRRAHQAYMDKLDRNRFDKAQEILDSCQASDWRLACSEWLERRRKSALRAADGGVQHG